MKKIYFLFALLLSFVGVTHVFAQDDDVITINVNSTTGDWLYANPARTWASQWQSNDDPKILIRESSSSNNGNGANNMAYVNGSIEFFNGLAGTGETCTYIISVASGYEFAGISLDFVANAANKEVYVSAEGVESEKNNSTSETIHFEYTDFAEGVSSFEFIVGGNTTGIFAITSNFTVYVRKSQQLTLLLAVLEQYEPYYTGGSLEFSSGTNPGDYTVEAVNAFNKAFEDCFALAESDEIMTMSSDEIAEFISKLESAYEAVLDSKIPLTLADGYYRFRTGMNYNDGKVKYMYVESGDPISGKWGSSEDAESNARYLWKLTKVETKDGEDIFDFVSVATDARFNDNPATLSAESEWRFVLEPVATIEGTTYVNIKYADRDPGAYNLIYIHQAGHSSGAGTGGNLTTWMPTSSIDGTTGAIKMAASEWAIESVSDTDAAAIIDAYADIKELEDMRKDYQQMVADAKENLSIAKDDPEITVNDEVSLITATTQLSSPWTDTTEGTDIGALIDDDINSFWHSNWHNGSVPVHTHYLDVALNEPTHDLISMVIRRRQTANNHTTAWSVYGSATPDTYYTQEEFDAGSIPEGKNVGDLKTSGEWHKLAELSTPYQNMAETVASLPFDTKSYPYLRFYIDGNTGGSGLCHMSEFQLHPATVKIATNAQYSVMGTLATNLEKVLSDQIEVVVANLTKAEYNALKTAYDAFMVKFVDPTALRAAIKTAEASTAGIVVGTNPGEWGGDTDAGALATTVANAKTYDASGDYTPAQSEEYVNNLKSLSGDVFASANKIQEGKWYRIHFGSKETFEANEWDIENNDDQIVAEEYVINESLWDKYITVAKRTTEEVTYYEEVDDGNGGTTSEERKATKNLVTPYDEDEVIARGAALYFDADGDIEDKDLSLFRFINVGDTAYVLQNKATGLFLRAENTTLDIIPSLFNVSAIGYGQNLIAASNIITGGSQSNLHFQRAQNRVVTYGENTAGSRSGLYIEEVSDVESDYDGTEFLMNLKPGSLKAFCFPVDLQPVADETSGEDYVFYDVTSVADGVVKLSEIQEANAGRPFIFIVEGTYNAEEDDAIFVAFKHGYEFTDKAIGTTSLKGTYSTINSINKGDMAIKENVFTVSTSAVMSTISVPAYSAYLSTEGGFELRNDYTYEIVEGIADGIETTLQKVAKTGDIYTLDGRLITRRGNLNTLRGLGKGIYIVNGVKVVVK